MFSIVPCTSSDSGWCREWPASTAQRLDAFRRTVRHLLPAQEMGPYILVPTVQTER